MTQAATGPPIRWGILGTGRIAASFVADLKQVPDAVVVAVGSRTQVGANAFGTRFRIPRRYGSYQQLCADAEVDVVYVASPNSGHHPHALMALEAGRSVLCEKPFTLDAAQAGELVSAAAQRGLFLMEAMWTRFLPHMQVIGQLLARGDLGEIVTVTADHGQWFAPDPEHRLFAPELGGGALLDLGVYPVSFATWVLGSPAGVVALGERTAAGVDAQTSILLRYRTGAHAVLTTTLRAPGANRAAIVGTDARIEIDPVWYAPAAITLTRRGGRQPERYSVPVDGSGLRFEAIEVGRCLREGLTESPSMTWAQSRAIMATMDEVRRQVGVRFPHEPAP